MSEKEFELYLSLLSRFLRLKPQQRAEIADELRDHLEERLEELTRRGLSREEAVRRALDEFGDASELAAHFTSLAKRRRRRAIMRWTFGTIGVTAALLFVGVFMWNPNPADDGPPEANAQQKADAPADLPDGLVASVPESAVEAKLKKRIETIEMVEKPLSEALDFISERIEVDIVVNVQSLEEEALTMDEPVTLKLKYTTVSAATALDLILERAAGNSLTYTIRDGFLYVQSAMAAEEDLEVRIYDVSDLLTIASPAAGADEAPEGQPAATRRGAPHFQVGGLDTAGQFGRQFGPGEPLAGPGQFQQVPPRAGPPMRPSAQLIDVIQEATSGPWMTLDGQGGTISEFGGLLVVRQNQAVHREIEEILEMMREAAAARKDDNKTASREGHGGPARAFVRGWFGLGLHGGRAEEKGVKVMRVYPDTPAERAGLKPGDRVLEVDGREVSTLQEIVGTPIKKKPGQYILIRFRREEKTIGAFLELPVDGGSTR